jgi:hypothetical protein
MLTDYPLICQNIRLPELAPGGLNTVGVRVSWLPRFQRAGPSTSLDKSAAKGYLNVGEYYHRSQRVSIWPPTSPETPPYNPINQRTR